MSEIFQIVNNTCAGSLCVLVPAGTSLAVIGTGSSAAGANFITGFEEQTYRIKLDRSHKTVSKWITIRHCNMKHLTVISSLEANFHTAPKATVWHMTSYPCKSRNLLCWGSTDLLCMEQGLWNTHLHLQHIRQSHQTGWQPHSAICWSFFVCFTTEWKHKKMWVSAD